MTRSTTTHEPYPVSLAPRFRCPFLAAVLCAVSALVALGVATEAVGAVPTDDYLAGYAAAVLERELKLAPRSLSVRDGVISVAAADLAGADRVAVTEVLRGIRGVRRVEVREGGDGSTSPSAPAVERPARAAGIEILPPGLLFHSLVADPRWPHFAASVRHYTGSRDFGNVAAVSIGDSIALVRGPLGETAQWEFGLQAAAFALFDGDSRSADLVNIDFVIAGFVGVRQGAWSGIARVLHASSHLGDEQVLHHGTNRINLSYEAADVRVSWEARDWLRLYGGVGYALRIEPTNFAPWSLQAGTELRSPWTPWPGRLRPILAVDLQSREEHDWRPQLTLRTGIEIEGAPVFGRRAQILLEYGTGRGVDGQFYRRDAEYVGLGLHFNY